MKQAKPPSADKSLPCFLHPLYLRVWNDLQLVQDVWDELKGCKAKYLPQEEAEPPKAYENRLGRSQFDSRFAPAIKAHAGLLSDFTLSDDVAESIKLNQSNIDQQGNDLETFLAELDEMVLRDGAAAIHVEFPPLPTDVDGNEILITAADEAALELRPYFVAIDRRNILNWDVEFVRGKPRINQVTIQETHLIKDGDFGVESKTYYRVLRPGSFDVFEIVEYEGKWLRKSVPELSGTTNLDAVPLVWYSISESKVFQANPPFLNLARLNIEHLQKRSSLNEVLHKCNLPVPVRKGLIRTIADLLKPIAKLVIGPNSVVDVPVDGDFYFAEPTGNAIAATQADIEKLEGSMDRVSLSFLNGGEAQKTATEVVLDSAQTQATLKGMARRKENAIEQAFGFWADYTGEESSGSIEVNESLLQIAPSAQDIQLILDAMGVKIPNRLALEMLLQRRWLPPETDLDEIIAMLEGVPEPAQAIAPITPPPEPNQPLATEADIQAEEMAIAA
jgi:hypothetical protein